jgi:uncharacterized membrane protein
METWLIYAIASIFLAGIYSFLVKVASHKHYNPSLITGYGYLSAAVFSGIYLLYTDINWNHSGYILLFFYTYQNGEYEKYRFSTFFLNI